MEKRMTQEEMRELADGLRKWKDQGEGYLQNVLKRIAEGGFDREAFGMFLDGFKKFIKSLNEETGFSQETIFLIKQSRAQVKKTEQAISKSAKKQKTHPVLPIPKKAHDFSKIQIPSNYGSCLTSTRKQTLHNLYRSFTHNLPQQLLHQHHPSLLSFLSKIESHFFEISRADFKTYLKKAQPVLEQLAADKAITAKVRMLEGKTRPEDVAEEKTSAFMSDEEIRRYEEASQKEMEYYNVDFYVRRMAGSEHCRYCKKQNSAYCQSQKQIRRADEPMTRFMKCNSCSRMWRD